ncbi:hypothetical protein H0H87_005474 [Tephrocybe sp. NHM501043]|nr:hypothetical protein H0H87_005474 [Tephrocybe sp. NHM501043]
MYGPVGPDGAPYTIELDGGAPRNLSSNKERYKSQVLLYHADNLSPGEHRVTMTCQPAASGQSCAIDYANVYTTTPPRSANETGLSTGSIVGITLSIASIFWVLVGLFFFLRRHRRLLRHHKLSRVDPTENTSYDAQPPLATISKFGPGPYSDSLTTGQNLEPTPFSSSLGPSLNSRPRSQDLVYPVPAKVATMGAKQQARFLQYAEQRDTMPSGTSSTRPAPPDVELRLNRPPMITIQNHPGQPATPTPLPKKGQRGPLHTVNVEDATSEQVPSIQPDERRPVLDATPGSVQRSSLISVPPDYQWATHSRPYSGL